MEEFINRLRENGLKVTPKRKAIIKAFFEAHRFLSPEEVYAAVKKIFKKVSFPSVYNNLETMLKIGILHKIDRPDRRLYYGLCHSGLKHHHHVVCIGCGKISEVAHCPIPHGRTVNGFEVVKHFIQMEGVCPDCQDRKKSRGRSGPGK